MEMMLFPSAFYGSGCYLIHIFTSVQLEKDGVISMQGFYLISEVNRHLIYMVAIEN